MGHVVATLKRRVFSASAVENRAVVIGCSDKPRIARAFLSAIF
jgi:hypothetical protein